MLYTTTQCIIWNNISCTQFIAPNSMHMHKTFRDKPPSWKSNHHRLHRSHAQNHLHEIKKTFYTTPTPSFSIEHHTVNRSFGGEHSQVKTKFFDRTTYLDVFRFSQSACMTSIYVPHLKSCAQPWFLCNSSSLLTEPPPYTPSRVTQVLYVCNASRILQKPSIH